MSQDEADRPRRKPRAKRAPRAKTGEGINVRVTAEEKQHLVREAGELGISTYVRKRLFDGGVRNRDALRNISALHVLGRRVQDLAKIRVSILGSSLKRLVIYARRLEA